VIALVEGTPWCMLAGPRAWDPARCRDALATLPDRAEYDAVDALLIPLAGPWVTGRSSVYPRDLAPREPMDLVFESLEDWHALLTRFDTAFAEIDDAHDETLERRIERAANVLLPIVVEYSQLEDQWYPQFSIALGWYCEHAGIPAVASEPVITQIVDGAFSSWIAPTDQVAAATAKRLGKEVAKLDRASPITLVRRSPTKTTDDPHVRFIHDVDTPRDRARGESLSIALDACRESAARDEPLSFALLARWQRAVLGGTPEPLAFRTTDAFAKRGRERYAYASDLEARFEAALRDAADPGVPVAVRAARVYLDVCFFHPFADGNARAARLAMDHVLTRAGCGLHAIAPIIQVAWAPHATPLLHVAHLIHQLIGTT
jgi:hypothetical protein